MNEATREHWRAEIAENQRKLDAAIADNEAAKARFEAQDAAFKKACADMVEEYFRPINELMEQTRREIMRSG